MGMTISQNGLDLIKRFEGFRNHPYLCSANVPTIGYGNTYYPDGKKVSLSDKPIKLKEGEVLLKHIVKVYEDTVNEMVNVTINQNQFDALVSFTYNLGGGNLSRSTLLKKINNNPNDSSIKGEFLKWNKANGKVLKGLTKRRNSEAYLYFTSI
jgi:lysozyme